MTRQHTLLHKKLNVKQRNSLQVSYMKVILIFFTFMFSENKTERLNVTHVAPFHLKKKIYIYVLVWEIQRLARLCVRGCVCVYIRQSSPDRRVGFY